MDNRIHLTTLQDTTALITALQMLDRQVSNAFPQVYRTLPNLEEKRTMFKQQIQRGIYNLMQEAEAARRFAIEELDKQEAEV